MCFNIHILILYASKYYVLTSIEHYFGAVVALVLGIPN